jgi:hypothetical protein
MFTGKLFSYIFMGSCLGFLLRFGLGLEFKNYALGDAHVEK